MTEVRQDGPRHLRVVVDDAGSSLPDVVERIKAAGGGVESAREQRLSFDEIFAILVARDDDERAAEEAADGRRAGGRSEGSRGMSLFKTLTRILAIVGKELVVDPAPAGRPDQPRPRAVPDHGPVRPGLQRLPPAARHDRRPARRARACRPT